MSVPAFGPDFWSGGNVSWGIVFVCTEHGVSVVKMGYHKFPPPPSFMDHGSGEGGINIRCIWGGVGWG